MTTTTRTRPSIRARTTSANIVCVGASRHDDTAADFSNYGETTVDVFAPGYGIISTFPGDAYTWGDGTSMATPHVAAEAALLLGPPTRRSRASRFRAGDRRAFRRPGPAGGICPSATAARTRTVRCARSTTTSTVSPDGLDNCPALQQSRPGRGRLPAGARRGRRRQDRPDGQVPRRGGGLCRRRLPQRRSDRRRRLLARCPRRVPRRGRHRPRLPRRRRRRRRQLGRQLPCEQERPARWTPTTMAPAVHATAIATETTSRTSPTTAPTTGPPARTAAIRRRRTRNRRRGPTRRRRRHRTPATPAQREPRRRITAARSRRSASSVRPRPAKRSATVKVATTRLADGAITVERKKGTALGAASRARTRAFGKPCDVEGLGLKRGTHRVRVSISSGAGNGTSVSKTFRVR